MDRANTMTTWLIVILTSLCIVSSVKAQQGGDPLIGQGTMGGGMMGPGVTPMMRMAPPRMGLMPMLHHWRSYFVSQRDRLNINETQIEKIESIFSLHMKYEIREDANRRILVLEIEDLLVKDKVDLEEVKTKVALLEALTKEMTMEEIRTLGQALAVLTPDQQTKIKALFKEATFARVMGIGPARSLVKER